MPPKAALRGNFIKLNTQFGIEEISPINNLRFWLKKLEKNKLSLQPKGLRKLEEKSIMLKKIKKSIELNTDPLRRS